MRKGMSDTTFEGKKHQPKFKGPTLYRENQPRDGRTDVRDAGVRQGCQAAVPDLHQAGDQGIFLLLTGIN